MQVRRLDFTEYVAQVRGMTIREIVGAIRDVRATLDSADAMDREDGGSRGGYYRDQASVLHRELDGRPEHFESTWCAAKAHARERAGRDGCAMVVYRRDVTFYVRPDGAEAPEGADVVEVVGS